MNIESMNESMNEIALFSAVVPIFQGIQGIIIHGS